MIEDAKFKTFGCGSAIASSSLATEWLKGKTVDEAMAIRNTAIVEELTLPPVKIHCSVLAEDAIKAAIKDYQEKQTGRTPAKPASGERAHGLCPASGDSQTLSSDRTLGDVNEQEAIGHGDHRDRKGGRARSSASSPSSKSAGVVPEKIYLRLRVVGGGCSGFQHKLDLDPTVNDEARRGLRVPRRRRGGGQAQPDVPRRRHGRFPRRPEPARLQHHQPAAPRAPAAAAARSRCDGSGRKGDAARLLASLRSRCARGRCSIACLSDGALGII